MPLTGPQFEQLQQAVLRAFDEPALKQMVRIHLGEDLSAIAGGANLGNTVFNLISWAERTGRTQELVSGASASNPHSPELKTFAAQYAGIATRGPSPIRAGQSRLPAKVWLVIEGLEFFAALPGAQVRVTAYVNGSEYVYPSVGGVEWLEVGPSMSAQKFRLPPADEYVVRFEAAVRVPGKGKKPEVAGTLTSVAEDVVDLTTDIPFTGRYILHTFDPDHMARSAEANAELTYRITYDP